jgi:hypothetical protein
MLRSDGDPSVTVYYRYSRSMRVLFVNLAAVRNSRHTHEFFLVIDDVHDAPVTDADTPLIVALEFFILLAVGSGPAIRLYARHATARYPVAPLIPSPQRALLRRSS